MLLAPPPIPAKSGRPVSPLGGVRIVDIDVGVGGGLAAEPYVRLELFAGDPSRAEEFEQAVVAHAADKLSDAGYEPRRPSEWDSSGSPEALESSDAGWMGAQFYGRPNELSESEMREYLFLVYVNAGTYSSADDPCSGESWSRKVIGAATDESLATEMLELFGQLLNELLAASERRGPSSSQQKAEKER